MSVEQRAIFGRGGVPHEGNNVLAEEIYLIVKTMDNERRETAVLTFIRLWNGCGMLERYLKKLGLRKIKSAKG